MQIACAYKTHDLAHSKCISANFLRNLWAFSETFDRECVVNCHKGRQICHNFLDRFVVTRESLNWRHQASDGRITWREHERERVSVDESRFGAKSLISMSFRCTFYSFCCALVGWGCSHWPSIQKPSKCQVHVDIDFYRARVAYCDVWRAFCCGQ